MSNKLYLAKPKKYIHNFYVFLNTYYFLDHKYLIILFQTKECEKKRQSKESAVESPAAALHPTEKCALSYQYFTNYYAFLNLADMRAIQT